MNFSTLSSHQLKQYHECKALMQVVPNYMKTVEAIDSILATIPSQEALNSNFLGRFFVSVADTFVGIIKTLGVNFTRFNQALKRSELNEFVASNKIKVSVVEGIPLEKVANLQMDIPAHMNTTFKQAIDTITNIHVALDAFNRSQRSKDAIIEVFKAITNKDGNVNKTIDAFALDTQAVMTKVKQLVLKCQKEFNDNMTAKKVYTAVYKDPQEFVQCKLSLLAIEDKLKEVHEMRKNIEDIEQQLRGISKAVEASEGTLISQASLVKFGEALKAMALIFDSVQMAATRQLTLEHNTILNYNTIYTKAR